MTPAAAISPAKATANLGQRRDGNRDQPPAAPTGRTLVLLPQSGDEAGVPPVPPGRPYVPFIAHLIATREHAPQLRERRRAEPAQVVAHYNAASKPQPTLLTRFNRSA